MILDKTLWWNNLKTSLKNSSSRLSRVWPKTLFILFLLTCVFWGVFENLWIDETPISHVEMKYVSVPTGVKNAVTFYSVYKNASQIALYFYNPDAEEGDVYLALQDDVGRVISEFEYPLEEFSQSEQLRLPLSIDSKINPFEKYQVIFEVKNRSSKAEPLQIGCMSWWKTLSKYQGTKYHPYVEVSAEKYLSFGSVIICVLLLIVGIFAVCVIPDIHINQGMPLEIAYILVSFIYYLIIEVAIGDFFFVTIGYIFLNVLIIYLVIRGISGLFGKNKVLLILATCVSAFWGIAEYHVLLYRETPIMPGDVLAVKTAATISLSYRYRCPIHVYLALIISILLIFVITRVRVENTVSNNYKFRIYDFLYSGMLILVLMFGVSPHLKSAAWDLAGEATTRGYIVSFVSQIKNLKISKPQGYNREEVHDILTMQNTVQNDGVQAQNIIVVMEESLADLRTIDSDKVSGEYLQNWYSVDNAIRGNVYVPVYGAGTCDTEFEALTGISTRYAGTYPYMSKIHSNTSSIALCLKDEGYDTNAFHPNEKNNWNRNVVYPLMGFNSFYGLEDMNASESVRWCVSDDSDFNFIIDKYNEKKTDKWFMFNVTMQNHGGYEKQYDNFENTVDLSEYGEYPDAEQYYSLISLSDKSIDKLIEYYSSVDEPTLICVFGDHQPQLSKEYLTELNGGDKKKRKSREQLMKYQATPFLIWANYPLDEQDGINISVNYLREKILYYSGQELNGFDSYMFNLEKDIPILNKYGIVDATGTYYKDEVNMPVVLRERVYEYECMCYYQLTDND